MSHGLLLILLRLPVKLLTFRWGISLLAELSSSLKDLVFLLTSGSLSFIYLFLIITLGVMDFNYVVFSNRCVALEEAKDKGPSGGLTLEIPSTLPCPCPWNGQLFPGSKRNFSLVCPGSTFNSTKLSSLFLI